MSDESVVMYIVVRRSLRMSIGKTAGQVGHAVHYFFRAYAFTVVGDAHVWEKSPEHTKVVLGATDEEFNLLKWQYPNAFVVRDIKLDTETCLSTWPMRKSQRTPLLASLRLL